MVGSSVKDFLSQLKVIRLYMYLLPLLSRPCQEVVVLLCTAVYVCYPARAALVSRCRPFPSFYSARAREEGKRVWPSLVDRFVLEECN